MTRLVPVLLNNLCLASSSIKGFPRTIPYPCNGLSSHFISSEFDGMTASSTISSTLLLKPWERINGFLVLTFRRECFRSDRLLLVFILENGSELIRHLFECWGLGTWALPCSLRTVFNWVTMKSGEPYLAPTCN